MTDTTPAPGAHRARRVLRALVSVLFYAAAAVAAWFVWPTNLGGCTTLTVVSGSSMEPTYVTGDLVVSRCGTPQVGDVVVYRPHELGGARIIHRLVGGDGTTGWVVQGDNNDWTDPFTPTDDEILGVAALHVPKVGLVGRLVTSPWVWGSCMLLALGLLVWPSSRDETDAASPDPAGTEPATEPGTEPATEPDGEPQDGTADPAGAPQDRTFAPAG